MAAAPSSAPKPSTSATITTTPSTASTDAQKDLLKKIRSHEVAIAELDNLYSTREREYIFSNKYTISNSFRTETIEYCESQAAAILISNKTIPPDKGYLYSPNSTKMALRGVWQMNKLVVSYCNWAGSSRGIREFMKSHLPAFKEVNPHLEVITELNRGQHPYLKGFYLNKNERVVCVKNLTPEDILMCATRLRNSLGRKVIKLRTRHVTKNPSVQGTWTTDLKI